MGRRVMAWDGMEQQSSLLMAWLYGYTLLLFRSVVGSMGEVSG